MEKDRKRIAWGKTSAKVEWEGVRYKGSLFREEEQEVERKGVETVVAELERISKMKQKKNCSGKFEGTEVGVGEPFGMYEFWEER
jgi:hypothetical protein